MNYYLKCYDLFIFPSFFFWGGGGWGGGGVAKHPVYEHSPWTGVLTDADPESHVCISKVYLSLFIISIVSMTLQISLVYHLYLN